MTVMLPPYKRARVLVAGDIMLDRHWYGHTSRISPEAPVPVVHVKQQQECPGAAANVALNIRALGGQVQLLSLCGDDVFADTLTKQLRDKDIEVTLQRVPNMPTITKLRVWSLHQQLIRLDFEEAFDQVDCQPLLTAYAEALANTHVVVLSDYAKGVLRYAPEFIAQARRANVPVFVDPKGQDFSRYRGAALLTPNRKEFEAIVGKCSDDAQLVERGFALMKTLDLQALLVTRGEEGMTLLSAGQTPLHLAAEKREVYDVTGAGDTVIGVLAASVAAGHSLEKAAVLANLAAGIVVTRLGAATVSVPELRRALHEAHNTRRGILTREQALLAIKDAHAHGERVVMTNGCFDILHPGHLTYLEQARQLGDHLLVAVNDDASVARLKGPQRPVNSLQHRMQMLMGLNAVDWVVPFSDDTPEELIKALLPDVLVKGGDYRPENIVGAQAVLDNGGVVRVLDFVPGHSTSEIIRKIQEEI